jgi:dienelactone hydrolase
MSCCPTEVLPVQGAKYDRKGDSVYITGTGKRGILFVPDIFGPHPNAFRVADFLASKGFVVVTPDFFRGGEWNIDDFPVPADNKELQQKFGNFWQSIQYPKVQDRVEQGVTLLKALGAESIGVVGFCWGGKIALNALGDGLVKCAATSHPAALTKEEAQKVKGPVCMLPSGDDGPLDEIKAELDRHSWADKNVYKFFDDMYHGWVCSPRVDFADDKQCARSHEALQIFVDFFDANL